MAVFRIERTRDYTVMSNHHLRDKALSLKSKGLLSMSCWDWQCSRMASSMSLTVHIIHSFLGKWWVYGWRRFFFGLKSMMCPSTTWAWRLILMSRRCWLSKAA